jgi:hypothetical protein
VFLSLPPCGGAEDFAEIFSEIFVGGVATSLVVPLTQKSAAKEALIFGLSRKGRVRNKVLLGS